MRAVVDIGNSKIKVGLVKNNIFEKTFSFATADLLIENLVNFKNINEFFFSSVVPNKTEALKNYAISQSINLQEITIYSDLGISISYKTPQTLGMDRVCGIIGAKYLANLMLINSDLIITVDCGTASTINVLYKNSFIGGMIAPGISTMFSSLNKNTSLLPDLDLENYENLIGDSTEASIVSGVVNSTIGYIERCVAQIEKIYKTKATVFITGGNCIKLLNYLDTSINYEKDLVLIGVNEVSVRTTVRGF